MKPSKILGRTALRFRAQELANLQQRRWAIVTPKKGEPYATAELGSLGMEDDLNIIHPIPGHA